jgi:hypothetical protein
MCEDFAPNFSKTRTACCIVTTHHHTLRFFSPGIFFTKNNVTVIYHFNTSEVIVAESQAVLNTRTEHDFQDAFKKIAKVLGKLHTHGKALFRG